MSIDLVRSRNSNIPYISCSSMGSTSSSFSVSALEEFDKSKGSARYAEDGMLLAKISGIGLFVEVEDSRRRRVGSSEALNMVGFAF